MKPIKILTLVLALVLLTAPIMVYNPAHAVTPINVEVMPTAGFANLNVTDPIHGLGIPNTVALGTIFHITVHLTGATVVNAPLGVAGIEVHLDFTQLLTYAAIVSFTDGLGTTILNAPVLEGKTGGIYKADGLTMVSGPLWTDGVQYIVAGASTGGGWNGADGVIVDIQFRLTAHPNTLDFPLADPQVDQFLTFTDVADPLANSIDHGNIDGSVTLQRTVFVFPTDPIITIAPPSITGATTIGAPVNYAVSITSDTFWDVAGYDITVNWNSALLSYVGFTPGNYFTIGGDAIFNFSITTASSAEIICTKLSDIVPSTGTGVVFTLNLAVAYVGSSYPALTCPITLGPTDLVSWAHPSRNVAPWFGSITAADMPYNASAPPGTHQRGQDASYTAGVIPPGANIDLYDQYTAPYGGQGQNIHSDSFAPQAQVCLYANVTYGGDRVSNKLVVFQVNNALSQKVTILQNYSDINGIATVCFRLPMSDFLIGGNGTGTWDPAIFGTWTVTATVELDQITVNDTMSFAVGWLVQVMSVTSDSSLYHKYAGVPMSFTADVRTIHEQPLNVLVSIDSYDVQGYPIGETSWWVTVSAIRNDTSNSMVPVNYMYGGGNLGVAGYYYGWGGAWGWTPYGPYEMVWYFGTYINQYIPTWTRVGVASVIGYALTDYPANGGTPYGPQSNADGTTTHFTINKY